MWDFFVDKSCTPGRHVGKFSHVKASYLNLFLRSVLNMPILSHLMLLSTFVGFIERISASTSGVFSF
jgi:hypothetical protein